MLQNTIKVGGITHLTDARFFAAYDVAYIGFCFDPQSPVYISPSQALAIRGWINGPQIVAEFANQDADNMRNIIQYMQPDVVQCEYSEWARLEKLMEEIALPLIVRVQTGEEVRALPGNIIYYLLPEDVPIPADIPPSSCMFESGNDITQLRIIPGTGLHITGTPEQETGIKSYDAIADWLEGMIC